MKDSEQQYRRLMEAHQDLLVTVNPQGLVLEANEAALKITGLTRDALRGTDFFRYFTEPERVREAYEEVVARGAVRQVPLTLRHPNGTLTAVLLDGTVYKGAEGELLGAVIVARAHAEQWATALGFANQELAHQYSENEKQAEELSIANTELAFQNDEKAKRAAELGLANIELAFQSAEKEKRAAELKLANLELAFQNVEKEKRAAELRLANYARRLIEASRDPLVTISPEGKITDMNQATVGITGRSREELRGSDFFVYFTDPQMARAVYEEVFAEGSVADAPLTLRHREGKLTDVLFNGSVYRNDQGEVLGVVVVAHDVTAQKRLAAELTEAKIAAELAAVHAEEAQARAEDAARAKQQFLSTMSHEIRTPMNAIVGFTQVLLKTPLSATQREYLMAVKLSGDALIVLINDILDLAKVDAGKMTFEQVPFRLAPAVAVMLRLFETKIQEKGLALVLDYDERIPAVLLGDPVRLHQVMLNLLSNAVKFTRAGRITVGVRLLVQDAARVVLEFAVADTGIGIAPAQLDSVFDNFQQATSGTSRLYGGTGLGLAIVKKLVEPQGGSVHVASVPGQGSTFSFVLSFPKTTEPAAADLDLPGASAAGLAGVRVLVVDDVALNQLLLRTLLEDVGCAVAEAANGQQAVELLRTTAFDVVLMDLQMPVMNGFEATACIRQELQLPVPIIALTADVTTADLAQCQAVGMNDYLAKPIDDQLLYRKITQLLQPAGQAARPAAAAGPPPAAAPTCVNFDYLKRITKTEARMAQMIRLYLQEIPQLVQVMKQAIGEQNWVALKMATHSIIPTFATMGMDPRFEDCAKAIQALAVILILKDTGDEARQQSATHLHTLFATIEAVCAQAAAELEAKLLVLTPAASPGHTGA